MAPSPTSSAPGVSKDAQGLLPIGTVLEGRYRLTRQLGAGGMGVVFEAKHLRLGHKVAVKLLHVQHVQHDAMRDRFDREAKALAALKHPNIVSVIDYGIADGMPYLVMELLEGRTLYDLLEKGRPPIAVAMHISRELLRGLAYAHAQGVVHRDLKPGNIFLSRPPDSNEEKVKILDFGFVKFTEGAEGVSPTPMTQSGMVFGTMGYMPPEQIAGGESGAYSDVYAVGVLMFELLTGRKPFQGEPQEIVRQSFTSPPPSLAQACPRLDPTPDLERCVAKALAKEGKDRYADAGEFLAAVEALPEPAAVGDSMTMAATLLATEPLTRSGRTGRHTLDTRGVPLPPVRRPKRWGRRLGLTLLALAALMLGGLYLGISKGLLALGDGVPSFLRDLAPTQQGAETADVAEPPTQAPSASEDAPPAATEAEDQARTEQAVEVMQGTAQALSDRLTKLGQGIAQAAQQVADDARGQGTPDPEATEGDATTSALTLPPDPWLARPLPRLLNNTHRMVLRGVSLRDSITRQLRRFARTHRNDPRPHLVLAQHYVNRELYGPALDRYSLAHNFDAASRGDPRMLQNLVMLAGTSQVGDRAAQMVVDIYGKEALGTIDAQLHQPGLSAAAARRLRRLRARID